MKQKRNPPKAHLHARKWKNVFSFHVCQCLHIRVLLMNATTTSPWKLLCSNVWTQKCAQEDQSARMSITIIRNFCGLERQQGLEDYLKQGDTLWKSPLCGCSACCSQRRQRALDGDWRLLMSWCSRDSQSLLGPLTGSVTVNKPALPTQLERTGCWSACVHLKELQGSRCPLLWHKQSSGVLWEAMASHPPWYRSQRRRNILSLSLFLCSTLLCQPLF